jgi:hypothetical protein
MPLGKWQKIKVTIQNEDSHVVIMMFINGEEVARLIDKSQTINKPGAVGIRGDNAEFLFKDFEVHHL